MHIFDSGEFYALVTALLWAIGTIAFADACRRLGSLPVNLIRMVLSVLFFSLVTGFVYGKWWPEDANPHQWFWLIISGFVGFFICDLFLFRALVEIGSRLCALIMSLAPFAAILTAWLWLGETLSLFSLLGMFITLAGVSWVVMEKARPETTVQPTTRGLIFAIVAAILQGMAIVLIKVGMVESFADLELKMQGVSVQELEPFAATQIRVLASIPGFFLVILVLGRLQKVGHAFYDIKGMGSLLVGTLVGPFIGAALLNIAVTKTSAGIVQTLLATIPVLILPFSYFIEKENVSIRAIAGAVVTVCGVGLLCI